MKFFTKSTFLNPIVSIFFLLVSSQANSQCALGSAEAGSGNSITPNTTFQSSAVGPGAYRDMAVTTGRLYSFQVDNASAWSNTYLTLLNGSSAVAANDDNGPYYNDNCSPGETTASLDWVATFTGTLRVQVNRSGCAGWIGAGSTNSATLKYRERIPGTVSSGSGTWNVYAYNGADRSISSSQKEFGSYSNSTLNINSTSQWLSAGSPSDASGWSGVTAPIDLHTVRYMRTGVPTAGKYGIHVLAHDDDARLVLNGTQVWDQTGCCTDRGYVWCGDLDGSSTLDFRVQEGCGGSNLTVEIDPIIVDETAGSSSWNVFAYNSTTPGTNYVGYYTQTSQDFNTSDRWGATSELSYTSINNTGGQKYIGCSTGIDNFSYRYKRTGFTCGIYTINVRHDDNLTITKNGATTLYNAGCCINTLSSGATSIFLGPSTTLDVVSVEGGGDAFTQLEFVKTGDLTITSSDAAMCLHNLSRNLIANVAGGTWSGTGVSGSSFNPATAGVGTHTITYSVDGCDATQTITVNASPTASPSSTPSSSCSGDNVTLAANATAGSGSISTYAWSTGLAGNVSGGTVNPTSNTTYTVMVTNSNSCTVSASTTVTIKSAANLVVLPGSTVTTAVEQCTDGGWTYYANASAPDDWLFAIDKNGNTFTASVDVTVSGSVFSSLNSATAGYEHGSYLMPRYWNVNLLTGSIGGSVGVRFFYDPSELSAAESARDAAWTPYSATASKTALRWFKSVGSAFNAATIAGIDGNSFLNFTNITLSPSSGTTNGVTYAEFSGITSFSGGTAGYGFSSPSTGLPVKLISFTAIGIKEEYIKLNWSTAVEVNNMGFEIERSEDGQTFMKIGWVAGNDNSTERIDYSYDDKTAEQGVQYYYRLKQIDNGNVAFEYSPIATAKLNPTAQSVVGDFVPNPSKEKSKIDVFVTKSQTVEAKVYDLTGKIVSSYSLQLNKGYNTLEITTIELPNSTYMVSFMLDDQRVTKRLSVVR
jgi:hypothetical protein